MKSIRHYLILIGFIIINGCENPDHSKSDMEIAEAFITNYEPLKAVPYLKSIAPKDADYSKAQELLQTINSVYQPEQKDTVNSVEPASISLSSTETKELTVLQKEWAKEQLKNYGNYFSDYRIESSSKIIFVLGKISSANGSVESHEELNASDLLYTYNQTLANKGLELYPLEIKFEKMKGVKVIKHKDLSTSPAGWVYAEYLYEGSGIYFGTGDEKQFIGKALRGYTENGQKYVVLEKEGNEEIKYKETITENALYFIKSDDPNYRKKLIRFK